jgi:2-polyprenyl-6-methoxyphenol hydroxylase-like FAD-dependent oxidoreductase
MLRPPRSRDAHERRPARTAARDAAVEHFDAVIVGARAAGAATGMLLARAGLRVLIVDRARYGADTVSTHALMRAGVLQLHRWGLLDRVVDAGTPAVRNVTFHVGDQHTAIALKGTNGVDALYAPRRTVLDPILADAAVDAGAEVRFGTTVTGLRRAADGRVTGIAGHDDAGRPFEASARITVGADGMTSKVAQWVAAPPQLVGSAASAFAFAYWPAPVGQGYEWYFRPGTSAGAIPTNDGHTCVFVGTTPARFRRELLGDPMAGYLALLEAAAPEIAAQLPDVPAPTGLRRFPGRRGLMREAFGAGWALVGDAGHYKDPITAHGLTDALRDAELLADAMVVTLHGGRDEASALARYEATRNHLSSDLFTTADTIAAYRWDAAEVDRLLHRLHTSMAAEVDALLALDRPARALAS